MAHARRLRLAVGTMASLALLTAAARPFAVRAASGVQPVVAGAGTYVVRPGDTLSGIAVRFGTTTAALVAANGLRADRYSALSFPALPNGTLHRPSAAQPCLVSDAREVREVPCLDRATAHRAVKGNGLRVRSTRTERGRRSGDAPATARRRPLRTVEAWRPTSLHV